MYEAVLKVMDSGWYLQGHENEHCEANHSKYIGSKQTIGCVNGLDALIWFFRVHVMIGIEKPQHHHMSDTKKGDEYYKYV